MASNDQLVKPPTLDVSIMTMYRLETQFAQLEYLN